VRQVPSDANRRWHKDLSLAGATRVLYPATIYLFSRLARSYRGGEYRVIDLRSILDRVLVRGCCGRSEKEKKITCGQRHLIGKINQSTMFLRRLTKKLSKSSRVFLYLDNFNMKIYINANYNKNTRKSFSSSIRL